MDPKPRLSCEQCRRRKIKCDKQAPCSSCRAAGLICEVVQRNRLPRGKSGKSRNRDGLLESRVSRIESLLAQAQVVSSKSEPKEMSSRSSLPKAADDSDLKSAARLDGYVATDFWESLAQEVAGLRETFEEQSDDEIGSPDLPHQNESSTISSDHSKLLFASSPSTTDNYSPTYPANALRTTLLATYKYRCDYVYKMLHWPTTLANIEASNACDHHGTSPADIAVEFSLYFMAVCSIREDEAASMLYGHDRTALLRQYMQATEWALAQCNLMQRPDFSSLLAFTLYLNCIWAIGKYATKWTLMAIAVRIGEALGLGREDPLMYTPFDLECRRRLWWGIGTLDAHSTYDRGSAPIMTAASLGPIPLNINDADMSPDSKSLTPSTGFTDMTFSLLAFEAVILNKRMYEANDWETKLRMVETYQDIAQHAIDIASGDSVLERLCREVAKVIASNMHLLLRRPPYRVPRHSVPPSDDFDIMDCAITVLEMYMQKKQGDLAAWEWKDWVPWYALAVVLSELCKTPTGPVADRAWSAALELYQTHARPASDLESGTLWKPITKLMRRVQRERPDSSPEQLAIRRSSASPRHPTLPHLDPLNQTLRSSNTALAYSPIVDFTGAQAQQGIPTHPTTSIPAFTSNMPAWPAFNPTSSMFDVNAREFNTKLYNDLDPANGVSWLDWDMFLDDQGYPMNLG